MKKVLALLLAALLVFSLVACTQTPAPTPAPPAATPTPGEPSPITPEVTPVDGIFLALVTDYGTIDDGSFNQGSWEGVVAFAEANGISHQYFQPADITTAAYIDAIELAIVGGAQLIVTPGFLFREAVYVAQDLFPDVKFVLIDSTPAPPGGAPVIAQNTVAVLYAEEESGFLAGYAAVMEGHRSLGFIGGLPVPAVVRFGHGFVEGAEYAAQQLGLAAGEVSINYAYAMTFSPAPEVQTMAAAWFNDGVEIIFAAAGGAGFSVMAAAEVAGGLVIGVDIDQASASETVITSALKGLQASVYSIITDFFNDEFPGGELKIFNAAMNGVGLPMETSRFQNFTQAQYDAIFALLASGEIVVNDTVEEGFGPLDLDTELVNIILIG
ncbi:MAG: BMP family ABC transporter substrate-binding protein [Oscillospiraceae bacterium]|nr:BMP family ABC transporter substrate-binding protein [Oscillospiraceae bacterium]